MIVTMMVLRVKSMLTYNLTLIKYSGHNYCIKQKVKLVMLIIKLPKKKSAIYSNIKWIQNTNFSFQNRKPYGQETSSFFCP